MLDRIETVDACAGCGCSVLRPDDFGHGLPLVRCAACGLVQQSPRPSFGARTEIFGAQGFKEPDEAKIEARAEAVRWLEDFVGRGRLLDVGCGDGALVAAATKQGWRAQGIDVCHASARCAAELGIAFEQTDFLEGDWPDASFDCVSFHYSFELLDNPLAALDRCHAILAPRGTVVLELVTLEGLVEYLPDTVRFGTPTRLLFPTVALVREWLWSSGFRIEDDSLVDWSRWVGRRR